MSGDTTYQALERLTHMPDRDEPQGHAIAGQYFNDVKFTGGEISGVSISSLAAPIAIADGGTGQITANAALNALLPAQASNSGKVLKTDGSNASWQSDTSGITQLTGDVTAGPGSGSQAATLATVNSNVGTFGSATQVAQVTLNGKGLATAATNVTVTPAASSITGGGDLTKVDDTNVTLTLGGTPTGALLKATSLTLGWTGTLAGSRGGTNNGFMQFSGPATSTKTYTLPNATCTILTTNAAVTVGQGGTGLGTLTANNLIIGNGSSTPNFLAPSTAGNSARSNGTTWVSVAPATYQATPANPTGTTSTTGVMMGLAGSITPTTSGKILIIISGAVSNGTSNDGAKAQIYYGTGTAPTNGAALTGNAVGNIISQTQLNNALVYPTPMNALVTGLAVGTAYWIDVSLAAIVGGTASISSISISVTEL